MYNADMKLTDFLQKQGIEPNLSRLLDEIIPTAICRIRNSIQTQKGELAGSKNIYGEKQLALDLQANEIILEELRKCRLVGGMASEEMEEGEIAQAQNAPFTVVFDPLDGSSLVDVNFAVGTIFGVYPDAELLGRTGGDQLAAGFAVYGPRTTLVLTAKKGTHEFMLASDGEFYLSRENLRVAPEFKHFAPGNLRAASEREDYLKLVNDWMKRGLTLRYSGGMVPDLNHILLKGDGIFSYPPFSKYPSGKLRLVFECAPMALLMEQAGGAASDGRMRILDKKITELHQRTPIYIGSKNAVNELANCLKVR